ncbi:MAG: NADH-quinone oxidoreductase subunit N [Acidithiobacillus ferrivorans]
MINADGIALLPLIILGVSVVVVMLQIAFYRHHGTTLLLTLMGLIGAISTIPLAWHITPIAVTPLLMIDRYALFYAALIIVAAFFIAVLTYGYLEERPGRREEFYILLLLATLGSAVMVASSDFASFFLGLELLSVSLFALVAYPMSETLSLEASIKYLVLAGVSSSFLLLGMALVYAQLGTIQFHQIGLILASNHFATDYFWPIGLVMIVTGVGFKLALVPFHMWTPDVYEGAPAPVTAYVATVSKGAMLALLLRYFILTGAHHDYLIFLMLSTIAIASMLVGNILALLQNNMKRILAYSSIAHFGYVLVAFLAAGALGIEAVTFYLIAYFVAMLAAFGVITQLSIHEGAKDRALIEDYRGLFWRKPAFASIFAIALFSLAGMPPTVGFIAEFYVILAGVAAQLWPLIFVLVVGNAIGLYYYLRIIIVMFESPTTEKVVRDATPFWAGNLVLISLTALMVSWGVYPDMLMQIVKTAATGLSH